MSARQPENDAGAAMSRDETSLASRSVDRSSRRFALLAALLCLIASPWANAAADCGRLSARDCQMKEGRELKENVLRNLEFVERVPAIGGRAEGVSGRQSVSRSLSGPTKIKGSVRIDRLSGVFRLKLASTKDVLQFGREIKIAGTVSVESGRLRIYSPVDMDFWQMATLFVDRPVRTKPSPDELLLKGWEVIDVAPGDVTRFSAMLIGIGGDDFLLLEAVDGEAKGIAFELVEP